MQRNERHKRGLDFNNKRRLSAMKKLLGLLVGIFVLFSAKAAEENPERFFADLTAAHPMFLTAK